MGYLDSETLTRRGTENSVIGITSKDDESKLRGSRGVLYLLEEAGSFPRLLNLYQVLRPSVEDGNSVWGTIFLYGTAGDAESDFSSMQELMYNPKGYNIQSVTNANSLLVLPVNISLSSSIGISSIMFLLLSKSKYSNNSIFFITITLPIYFYFSNNCFNNNYVYC